MGVSFSEWLESGKLGWAYKHMVLVVLKAKWEEMHSSWLQNHSFAEAESAEEAE